MKVSQVMKRNVRSCGEYDSLSTAAQIMWENDCGCVPVCDGEGHVVGMITDRDICMAAYLQGGPLWALQVSSADAKEVFSCRPDDSVATAEAQMQAHQVRRLPVVDDQSRLIGLLSLNDVVAEAGHEASLKKKDVTYAEVGETLREVCKRRGDGAIAAAG